MVSVCNIIMVGVFYYNALGVYGPVVVSKRSIPRVTLEYDVIIRTYTDCGGIGVGREEIDRCFFFLFNENPSSDAYSLFRTTGKNDRRARRDRLAKQRDSKDDEWSAGWDTYGGRIPKPKTRWNGNRMV